MPVFVKIFKYGGSHPIYFSAVIPTTLFYFPGLNFPYLEVLKFLRSLEYENTQLQTKVWIQVFTFKLYIFGTSYLNGSISIATPIHDYV